MSGKVECLGSNKGLKKMLRFAKILYSKEIKEAECMAITRISPKHQITIPKEAFEKLHLEVGDFFGGGCGRRRSSPYPQETHF